LIGLLLPALGKARKAARQSISLSNMKNVTVGSNTYGSDNKGSPPIVAAYGAAANVTTPPTATAIPTGWATSSAMGKPCNTDAGSPWITDYDFMPADRKMNQYLFTGDLPNGLAANAPERKNFNLPVFRDPSDTIGHQRNWPGPNIGTGAGI